jgi:DtxR family Mn-dependent transcriptional regulator
MEKALSRAVQDYLKIIYDLSLSHQRASTTDIANCLDVTPASVTGMLKKLARSQPPLVDYQKHQGVTLTAAGKREALAVIRRHRLLELFLYEVLDYSWDQIDAEACRLEHVISDQFEERIAQTLGNPTHDPHGDPIPSPDLEMPACATTSLKSLRGEQRAIVKRVRDYDPELLRYLREQGIVPGAWFTLLEYRPYDGNSTLLVDGHDEPLVLGPSITRQIFVQTKEAVVSP